MTDEMIQMAFSRVKEDINLLKKELERNKKDILEQKELLKSINKKLEDIFDRKEEKEENSSSFNISSGNKGVDNNRQQSTINSQQSSTMDNGQIYDEEVKKGLKTINEILTARFDSLTDREFATYITIYDLEKESGREVIYADLALRLNLTESSVRSHVAHLLAKKIPLTKQRYFNGKSTLSIKKGFKDPEILATLIKARQKKNTQTTLFDI